MPGSYNLWSLWARNLSVASAFCLIVGGAEAFYYPSVFRATGAILVGLIVAAIEYPVAGIQHLAPISTSFYVRAVAYVVGSIPFFFDVPTTTGALCLVLNGLLYFVAGNRGEEWSHPSDWHKQRRPPAADKKVPELEQITVVHGDKLNGLCVAPRRHSGHALHRGIPSASWPRFRRLSQDPQSASSQAHFELTRGTPGYADEYEQTYPQLTNNHYAGYHHGR